MRKNLFLVGLLMLLSAAILNAAADIYEPNNEQIKAKKISINQEVQAIIDNPSDADYFLITIDKPGTLLVDITEVPSNMTLFCKIYNNKGIEFSNRSSKPFYAHYVVPAGTYYIYFSGYNGAWNKDDLYKFSVKLDTQDKYEINNDEKKAFSVKLNEDIQALIAHPEDADYFIITTDKPGTLFVDILEVPSNMTLFCKVYNNKGIEFSNRSSTPFYTHYVVPAGTYFLYFSGYNGAWNKDDLYKFIVKLDTNDIFEMNNEEKNATLIKLNEEYQASIPHPADADYFKITIDKPGTLLVDILEVPSNMTLYCKVYNNKGIEYSNRGSKPFYAHYVVPSGTYFIYFSGYNGAWNKDDLYKFSVKLDTHDIFEMNNEEKNATVIKMNEEYQASIPHPADADYFKITTIKPGTLLVDIEEIPTDMTLYCKIYNNKGIEFSNRNSRPFCVQNLLPAGMYYIFFSGYNGAWNKEDLYKFKVSNLEAIQYNPSRNELSLLLVISFETNSSTIKDNFTDDIDKFGKYLQSNNAKVEIQGHTDNVGDAAYNLKLSEERAAAVKEKLTVEYKISVDRLQIKGYGDTKPIADNTTEEGRSKNRRIEAKIISQ